MKKPCSEREQGDCGDRTVAQPAFVFRAKVKAFRLR